MTGEAAPLSIELLPASLEQKPVIADLLQLYAREFSEFHSIEFGADGRYQYPHLDLYWQYQGLYPFLVTVDRQPAGFVLVQQGSQITGERSVWDMAEFFVVRVHRRHGVGTVAAHQVWRKFPGRWEVRVLGANQSAHPFWQCAIREFASAPIRPSGISVNGKTWSVFSFLSPHP